MSPIRVGLVCPYDLSAPGGVQTQVLGLADYLNRSGDEAVVIGPGLPQGIEGVDLGRSLAIPGNGSMVPVSVDPRARTRLRAVAASVDLFHVHEPLMPLVSLFANHAGPPVVATFHAAPGRAGRLVYRLTRPLFDRLLGNVVAKTAVSPIAAAVLPQGNNVEIIPNGLAVDAMRVDVAREDHKVVFLGRDEPRKGLDVLLRAWPQVIDAFPGASLVVLGADRGLPGVTWMGRVDDDTRARELSSAALFVAPHIGGESFGIVLVEAMAAGAAVVASNLDAFVAVAEGAARFFPVGDSGALADMIVGLLDDPTERSRLTTAGEARAARYDWAVVGAAYRDLYARVAP